MPTATAIASAVKARRRPGAVAVNLTLSIEADELLEQFAGGTMSKGRFLEVLILEHRARVEERQRLREEMASPAADVIDTNRRGR